jgi:hypothetical protein
MNSIAADWQCHYRGLEWAIRDLARMTEIAQLCTEELNISRLLFAIRMIETMAADLEKTYEKAFQSAPAKSAA